MGRFSETNIVDLEPEINGVINSYAENMRNTRPPTAAGFRFRRGNNIEWNIVHDPLSICPNSFIEFAFVKTDWSREFFDEPETVFLFIAYDGDSMSPEIKAVVSEMVRLQRTHRVLTLYFNSILFVKHEELHFIPMMLWGLCSRLSKESAWANEKLYRKNHILIHRNVL